MVCLIIGLSCSPPASTFTPPNFIIILADDLGYGDISPYGGWIQTPHLDRMAQEGMRFTDFHSNGAVCSPTRAGLLTGRYPHRAGIPGVVYADPKRNRHHGLQLHEPTFAKSLKASGYNTAMYGKWHLGYQPRYNPIHHGFDEFRGYVSGNVDFFSHVDQAGFFDWWNGDTLEQEPGYVTHLITEHALEYIDQHAGNEAPFCLYLAHEAPHYPYQGPQDTAFRVVGKQVPEIREEAQVKRAYREMVEEMDIGIGQIMEKLDSLGLTDNTFIFFMSDNGAVARGSNGELRGHKGSLWEGGHRVPAIARWPGKIPAGTTTDQLAIGMDVFPTLLAYAHIPDSTPLALDGESLVPVLTNSKLLEERSVYWLYNRSAAVRKGPWKLRLTQAVDAPERLELYDLRNDLGEQTDIRAQHLPQAEAMRKELDAWIEATLSTATQQPQKPLVTD